MIRRTKYRNRPTVCKQLHNHQSKKEANRCNELTLMEKAKVIFNLKQQPKFPLQYKFDFQGKVIREIAYIADFSYYDNEKKKFVIEDTKGVKTDVYKLKVKLLKNILKDADDFIFIES